MRHGNHIHRFLLPICLVGLLAVGGCTSGSDSSSDGSDNDTSDIDDDSDSDSDNTSASARIGRFDAQGNFQGGSIAADVLSPTAGQSSALSLRLRAGDGTAFTEPTDVFFSSPCITAGNATIDPAVVTNTDGEIGTTYTPLGCDSADTVTARTSFNSQTLSAEVTLQPMASRAAALAFTGTTNAQIGIQGTGILPPQSRITFVLTDEGGNPVPNQAVDFSPDTTVGGLSISPVTTRTNTNGEASTTVTSGTQATTVQVGASSVGVGGQTVSGQSRTLAVTTGLADQDSFSVSAASTNIEGYEFDGTTTAVTVRAADRFNNPVPDGTTINFLTEGGAIPGSCQTADGTCSVEFVSQNPRPADGRVTILATATGEESFTDSAPSNGRYNAGEQFEDTPEAWLDSNENHERDSDERFIDFNDDGIYNGESGTFNGLLCSAGNRCGKRNTIAVRGQVVIVLSGSSLSIDLRDTIDLTDGNSRVIVTVADQNGQKPPENTIVEATTTQGSIDGPTSFTVPATSTPGGYSQIFQLEPGASSGTGTFRVTVTTPQGIIQRDTAVVTQSEQTDEAP